MRPAEALDPYLPSWLAIDRDSGQAIPLKEPSRSPSFLNYRLSGCRDGHEGPIYTYEVVE